MDEKIKAAIIIDSPSLSLDLFYDVTEENIDTPFGRTTLITGDIGSATITLVYRFGKANKLNPLLVNYRAYVWALAARNIKLVLSFVYANLCNTEMRIAKPLLFTDVFFPENRLPDGVVCTMFNQPGDPKRGNYVFDEPFAPSVRKVAADTIKRCDYDFYEGICGYFPSLRGTSKSEAMYFYSMGLTAITTVGIPEVILSGEMEIPSILLGFGINYINGLTEKKLPLSEVTTYTEMANQFFSEFISNFFSNVKKDEIHFDGGFIYRPHQEMV
ncbi:MAG: hypothetical protein AB1765_02205 [Candidatus Hydrogenedentota bacterium]